MLVRGLQINGLALLGALLLVLVSNQRLAESTKWSLCDKDKIEANVSNLIVSDCETLNETCPFNRGFNKSIELDFTPNKQIESVKVKIAGKLSRLPIPWSVKPDEACGNYGFECPLEPNKAYKFKLTVPVLRTYPQLNVNVFLRLVDEADNVLACVEIPARIQEPKKEETAAAH